MICPDCGYKFARDTHTRLGFWTMVQQHAHYHLSHRDKYDTAAEETGTELAPPTMSHTVVVSGWFKSGQPLGADRRSFMLSYANVSAPAAVAAAERDARHIFGTDTDAPVMIDRIYVSN